MKHENTRALFTYWNVLRADRPAPFRSELDPRAIAPLLESTFILEHGETTTPRFRLAGTRLCDQFGMELRGMSALSLWHGEGRAQLRELLAGVVRDPGVGIADCAVETRDGALIEAEFLFLPLRNDLGEMNRILGCGYYLGARDLGGPGGAPIHHWVENVRLHGVDGVADPLGAAPLYETRGGAVSRARRALGGDKASGAPTRRRSDRISATSREEDRFGLRDPRAAIAALRSADRSASAHDRPSLYAIDGGKPAMSAVDRLAAERVRSDGAEAVRGGHLRLLDGGRD